MNPEKRSILPGLAFKGFSSRYQRPGLSEGFQDITEVTFKVSFSHALNDYSRSDEAQCSSMEMKRNVKFGDGTGYEDPCDIGFVHELPCALHAFSLSHGASSTTLPNSSIPATQTPMSDNKMDGYTTFFEACSYAELS